MNRTSMAYSTILTLAKVTDSDEGLYMCKSLSPKTIQMTYQVRVIGKYENDFYGLILEFFFRKFAYNSKTIINSSG
jgi:hypothetical protein